MEDHQAGEALEEVEEEALLEEVEEEAVGVEDFKYSTTRKHQSNLMKTIHIEIYLHQLGMKLSVYLYSKKKLCLCHYYWWFLFFKLASIFA